MSGIIAALGYNNVVPSLFQGLQRMPFEDGEYEGVTIATLMERRIQQRHFFKPDFSTFLQKQTLTGCLNLACIRQKQQSQKSQVHLVATEQIAIASHGFIDNIPEIREELLQLGYEVDSLCPSELILRFICRYLDIEMSAREASLIVFRRLKGEFAIIALFALEESLIVAQRGVPMMLGIKDNEVYIGSDIIALNYLVQPIMQIEENSLLILRSFQNYPKSNLEIVQHI
ncbi:MAG: hypothetical protein VSS75_014495 [Candidatus Parabeggiatoa sp.]|nr:hypothetical protein [Candidatus Parabeggiatoa sp.]